MALYPGKSPSLEKSEDASELGLNQLQAALLELENELIKTEALQNNDRSALHPVFQELFSALETIVRSLNALPDPEGIIGEIIEAIFIMIEEFREFTEERKALSKQNFTDFMNFIVQLAQVKGAEENKLRQHLEYDQFTLIAALKKKPIQEEAWDDLIAYLIQEEKSFSPTDTLVDLFTQNKDAILAYLNSNHTVNEQIWRGFRHEINNPATTVISSFDFLVETMPDSPEKDLFIKLKASFLDLCDVLGRRFPNLTIHHPNFIPERMRVLLVEDEKAVIEAVTNAFKARLGEVTVARNRAELESLAAEVNQRVFDVVLLDKQLIQVEQGNVVITDGAELVPVIQQTWPDSLLLGHTGMRQKDWNGIFPEGIKICRKGDFAIEINNHFES